MKFTGFRLLCIALWIATACTSVADTYPHDGRSWEQVSEKFLWVSDVRPSAQFHEVDSAWGQLDAWRLRDLNSTRALKFLTSYTATDQPAALRTKAILALGWGGYNEAIPLLCAIASDRAEPAKIRAAALDPGLTAIPRGNATVLRTAFALSSDDEPSLRGAAYIVLGKQQNARVFAFLIQRLRTGDAPAARALLVAIATAKEKAAARIILEHCSPADLPNDALELYVSIIASSSLPEAGDELFRLLPQTKGFTRESILRYFSKHPREAVVPHIIQHVKESASSSRRGTVDYRILTAFIAAPNISQASKAQLADILTSGKVWVPGDIESKDLRPTERRLEKAK